MPVRPETLTRREKNKATAIAKLFSLHVNAKKRQLQSVLPYTQTQKLERQSLMRYTQTQKAKEKY